MPRGVSNLLSAVAPALPRSGSSIVLGLRGLPLLGLALGCQLALRAGVPFAHSVFAVASLFLVIAFAVFNLRAPGFLLVLAGAALNAAVIFANGTMPVSSAAARAVDASRSVASAVHAPLGASTQLPQLADRIVLGNQVWSPGDVLLAAGLAIWGLSLLNPHSRIVYGGAPSQTYRRGEG